METLKEMGRIVEVAVEVDSGEHRSASVRSHGCFTENGTKENERKILHQTPQKESQKSILLHAHTFTHTHHSHARASAHKTCKITHILLIIALHNWTLNAFLQIHYQ